MAFTTWTKLYTDMLDAWESGQHLVKTFARGDKQVTYKSTAEFLEALEYAERRADRETGSYKGRVYGRI